jgi:pheromone shutdown-related protein TraB
MESGGSVTRLEHGGKDITIVATAHVSQKSVEEVRQVISELRPDTVCVELDRGRLESLVDPKRFRKLNLVDVIKEKRVLYVLANLALSAYQKKIGDKVGVRPGAELLAAVEASKDVGAELVLADRDIQATLKRTWASVSFWNKLRLGGSLVAAPFAMEEISEAQIEGLKDRETIADMLTELARLVPGLKEPLIDERDQYLASSIERAPGKRVVAVVGAGHVQGILNGLGKPVDRPNLEKLPTPTVASRMVGWLVPIIVLGTFYFVSSRSHSTEPLLRMLIAWVLPTSLGCALFAAAAAAHPLTVLGALFTAPITTLTPFVGSGTVSALVEVYVRRPTVSDCEAIPESVTSIRGWYRNAATRVLLVFLLSSIGAAIGMLIGAVWVVSLV